MSQSCFSLGFLSKILSGSSLQYVGIRGIYTGVCLECERSVFPNKSGKRYRHKSMHVSKKQQDYWLIIHDKLEDRFTTITHRCQDFSHKDRCAYITS